MTSIIKSLFRFLFGSASLLLSIIIIILSADILYSDFRDYMSGLSEYSLSALIATALTLLVLSIILFIIALKLLRPFKPRKSKEKKPVVFPATPSQPSAQRNDIAPNNTAITTDATTITNHKELSESDLARRHALDISLVDGMDGHEFEHFCADLLKYNGFTEISVTPPSGDQGVDILATKNAIRYAIQCKNYASNLGNTPIQEVNTGKIFYNCHVGVVLTNSHFTVGAVELAKSTNTLLWDRTELQRLMFKAAFKKYPNTKKE